VYCEDYAGYYTVILLFLAFRFCSAYFIYLVSCKRYAEQRTKPRWGSPLQPTKAVGLADHSTPTTIHHRVVAPRTFQFIDLRVSRQCRLPYSIKPFTDEVLCDVAPLDVSDVLLGQPYLWKRHVVYESRPRAVIITLGNKLYRILEIAPPTTISLVTAKQCSKLISQTRKFVFLMIRPQGKRKTVAMTSRQGPTARKQ
jgi:hypothetical protein